MLGLLGTGFYMDTNEPLANDGGLEDVAGLCEGAKSVLLVRFIDSEQSFKESTTPLTDPGSLRVFLPLWHEGKLPFCESN
jgi:hypothetical protein